MVYAHRTKDRKRRREMLKVIINNLLSLLECNDTELERVPIIKLNSISMDTFSFLKWVRKEYRELHDSHIYTNGQDGTP